MNISEAKAYFDEKRKQGFAKPKIKERWKKVVDTMAVHIDGVFPQKLIEKRRPYEDDKILEYRNENYEPITVDVMRAAMDGLHRIFNEQNYKIKISQDLDEYIGQNNFYGKDFISYVKDTLMVNMLRDPNAIVVVWPGGQGLVNDVKKIAPYLVYVESERVVEKSENILIYCATMPNSTSYLNSANEYYVITDTDYYIARRNGKRYELTPFYPHKFGVSPFVTLGGVWNQTDGYYMSYFHAAAAFGNEAIKQYSDWAGSMVHSSHPIREIRAMRCRAKGCQKGYIGEQICHKCNGTGKEIALGPYGVILDEGSAPMDNAETQKPPIIWHVPPIQALEFGRAAWKDMLDRMRQALNMDDVQEAQSGVAKIIDREREYAMILKISDNVWDNVVWTLLSFMERLRNAQTYQEPVIVKPTQFSVKTANDVLNDLAVIREKGLPISLQVEVMREFIGKRYAGDDLKYQKHNFLMDTDPFYALDEPEKDMKLLNNPALSEQIAYSTYAPIIVDRLIRTTALPMTLFENYETLAAQVKKLLPEYNIAKPQTPLINPNNIQL